jgi:ribosomal protein S3AE
MTAFIKEEINMSIDNQTNNIDPFKHVMIERYIKCNFIYYFANDSNSENKGT